MAGLFGKIFDLNRDGKLDTWERAMESEDENDEEGLTELELAGIDPIELEYMDMDKRREILEDAGLNPDDFDF